MSAAAIVALIGAFVAGGTVGVLVAALTGAAARAERERELLERWGRTPPAPEAADFMWPRCR